MRKRTIAVAVTALLTLLFAIAALGFGLAAIYTAIATITAPPIAAIAVAGAALVSALATTLVGRRLARGPVRKRNERAERCDGHARTADFGIELAREAASFARTHPHLSVVGCLIVGYALGADPKLRTAVRDMIEAL